MKISGAELAAFLDPETGGWPEPQDSWYWSHDVFDDPDPNTIYNTADLGDIMWQGRRYDCPHSDDWISLDACIRKWRKKRDTVTLAIEVPKERLTLVQESLKALGIKV